MTQTSPQNMSPSRQFALALARAFGGAIIFGLPMLMTQEMWALGAVVDRGRLLLLLVTALPLLVGLSAIAGFEQTLRLKHDVVDAFVALAVGAAAASVILALFGVLHRGTTLSAAVGVVTLQAIPGSIGALLAVSQFGQEGDDGNESGDDGPGTHHGYLWELFLMAVGALFLSFNIAPTTEVTRLAMQMQPWQTLVAIGLSLTLMHAFVYAVEFSGQATVRPGTPFLSVFLRYSVPGYAIALAMSAYILWTFGRLDGVGGGEAVSIVVALGVPAAVGAAAARLIL